MFITRNQPTKRISPCLHLKAAKPDLTIAQSRHCQIRPWQTQKFQKCTCLSKIGVQQAWQTTSGSSKVLVADIDTGIDYNHEDLINNTWRNPNEIAGDGVDNDGNGFVDDIVGWDFRDKDARPFDDNSHGSHTAGTIAATGGNGIGISGVAQQASVMSLRYFGWFRRLWFT